MTQIYHMYSLCLNEVIVYSEHAGSLFHSSQELPESARNQLITIWTLYQRAGEHTANGFSLATNVAQRRFLAFILSRFLAFLSGS